MRKLIYLPSRASYAVEDSAAEVERTQLGGGAGRYRRDIIGVSKLVNCQWIVDRDGYDYLCRFHRAFNAQPGPFLADLVVAESLLIGCRAWFMPKSFRLSEIRGQSYFCTAQLEVEPPAYDPQADADFLDVVELLGVQWAVWADRLNIVVNHHLPGVFPL